MTRPWTPERSARAWRWVYGLLIFAGLCYAFAIFAMVMAMVTG